MKITIKNVITTLLLQIIIIISGLIIPKLIICTYGSDVNGLIVSITQFLGYITLLESGLGPLIKSILYKPISKNDNETIKRILKISEKIFRKISFIFIIYIILLCIIMPLILNNNFSFIYTISLIIIISLSIFAEYFFGMTYKLYLQAKAKIYIISIIQIITLLINTIITIILININIDIHIVKLVNALLFIIRPIAQNFYVKKIYNINLKNVNGNYEIKQKFDAFAQHLAYTMHENVDFILITLFLNIKEVSVFYIYYLIVKSIKNVVSSFLGGADALFGNMIANNDKEKLNKNFKIYIDCYYTITTIIFVCTFFLILPFVKLYTKGFTDINYIRPIFSYLIVISYFLLMLKQPFYDLVKAAGHFKETKIGAWIEVIVNITISIILIFKLGIVGVIIGTIISTLIRTIEIIYHALKNILNIKISFIIKKTIIILLEFIIIYLINNLIIININNYFYWIIYAIIIFIISSVIIIISNILTKNLSINEIKKYKIKTIK